MLGLCPVTELRIGEPAWPEAANGEFYGPRWNVRGAPVRLRPDEKRSAKEDTARMLHISEARTGTVFSLGN